MGVTAIVRTKPSNRRCNGMDTGKGIGEISDRIKASC
jgi:hypothetical protein